MSVLTIGRNWKSGVEHGSFILPKAVVVHEKADYDYAKKFRKEGFLSDIETKVEVDNISKEIILQNKHGYAYVGSKEFFIYSQKAIFIGRTFGCDSVPEEVKIALGEDDISSSPYSNSLHTTIETIKLDSIPTFLTPMNIYKLDGFHLQASSLYNKFDNNLLSDVLYNEGSSGYTIIEENSTNEIYEVESIYKLNESIHSLISPTQFIYNPNDGLLYIIGYSGPVIVTYETSIIDKVKASSNFTPSFIGRSKGIVSIISENKISSVDKNYSARRKNVSKNGTTLFIRQVNHETIIVDPKSIYEDKDGNEIDYKTLVNNRTHVTIDTSDSKYLGPVYISGNKVGYINNYSTIVPIVGYIGDYTHNTFQVSKNASYKIKVPDSRLYNGKFRVKFWNAETGDIIGNEVFIILHSRTDTVLYSGDRKIVYVPKDIVNVNIVDICNIENIDAYSLRSTMLNVRDRIDFTVSIAREDGINITLERNETGSIIEYYTLQHRAISVRSKDYYGI